MTRSPAADTTIRGLITECRAEAFRPGFPASDAQVLGIILARYLKWDGEAILEAAFEALQDANWHAEARAVHSLRMTKS